MAPEPHPPLFAYLPPKIHARLGEELLPRRRNAAV